MPENKFGVEELGDIRAPFIHADKAPDTMKIASDDVESGFLIINASDFDPKQHKKYKGAE